ncbi:MAG: bifunctional phosphopantothenoylcysteine decarboxylase/phosphopantothenate--cysteine ligase CoaBC [Acidaminobacteraceae bacterium]
MLKGKNVVLGVTGGIAAYKAADIASRMRKLGINVNVIMTKGATQFVTPLTLQSISQNYVVTDMFEDPKTWDVEHIALAKKADVFLIAPCTANVIGKINAGIADDMLTTTLMATKAPVLIAPAMNTNMYENPITQRNIESLKELGYNFVAPAFGRLACGDTGAGKLEDTEIIVERTVDLLLRSDKLKGKKVLVTAGPTIEDIDPFRYITNNSSGKMGYALARVALQMGAEVTLVTGETHIKTPSAVNVIQVRSSEDMYKAVMEHSDVDYIFKAAAVSDYTPKDKSDIKVKKSSDDLTIELARTIDILSELGNNKKNQILVGFAAETNDIIDYAKEKIKKKNLDYIVVNDISKAGAGFKSDTNIVSVIDKDGNISESGLLSKLDIAKFIIDTIL